MRWMEVLFLSAAILVMAEANFWFLIPEDVLTKRSNFDLCQVHPQQTTPLPCQDWIKSYLKIMAKTKAVQDRKQEERQRKKEAEDERFRKVVHNPVNRDFILRNLK